MELDKTVKCTFFHTLYVASFPLIFSIRSYYCGKTFASRDHFLGPNKVDMFTIFAILFAFLMQMHISLDNISLLRQPSVSGT